MSRQAEREAFVEAVLFVAAEPVPRAKLLELFSERERDRAAEALETVRGRYAAAPERGIVLEEVAGGLRLVTRPELHADLRRFFEVSGRNRLSMAALETLAIVAYRQPITAPEVQELRGVGSAGVLRTLLERRLVRIAGRKEVVGKPFLYKTTREFLMHFGLQTLDDLPPLEEFDELVGAAGGDGAGEEAGELEPDEPAEDEAAAGGADAAAAAASEPPGPAAGDTGTSDGGAA